MPRALRSFRLTVAALAVAALAACGGSPVPPQQTYATIRGRVYDSATNAGVAGAVVTIDETLNATSGSDGTYRISTVPPGPYSLRVAQPSGYAAPALPATATNGSVQAGETASVDVPLQKNP